MFPPSTGIQTFLHSLWTGIPVPQGNLSFHSWILLWIPRFIFPILICILLFALLPRFRKSLLFLVSVGALTVFLGARLISLHLIFCLIWFQILQWGSRQDSNSTRRKITWFVLILSNLIYFGLMNFYRMLPRETFPNVKDLGIAYLYWRVIHVTIDWKKGTFPPLSRLNFLLYLFYFPTMKGGPIQRYQPFMESPFFAGERWRFTIDSRMSLRVLGGLAKLFVSMQFLSLPYETLWNESGTLPYSILLKILYIRAISFYLIASGSNDLTIMFSKMLGIPLAENYHYPYFQSNLAHFWKHWHMTLTSCLGEYIYEPMGGMRRHQYFNYMITFLVCGLWHVTSPAFLIWGLMHGLGLCGLRVWQGFWKKNVPSFGPWAAPLRLVQQSIRRVPYLSSTLGCVVTFHFVALSWLPFWGGHPQGTLAMLRVLGLEKIFVWL